MSLTKKRAANKKLTATVPRKASKQHALRVERYFEMLNPEGLNFFQSMHKLEELGLREACLTGISQPHATDSGRLCGTELEYMH